MAVTLENLLTPVTEAEALDSALGILSTLGFPTTSWQDGSAARTLVQLGANLYSSLTITTAQIAAGGFNRTAVAGWLDLFAQDFFENVRVAAVETEGVIRLTSTAAAPPYVIAAGDLQIADTATATPATQTFRNTGAGTLNPGSTLDLAFEAEIAGEDGNIPTGSVLYMWTVLVGVTATNPAIGVSGTWITTPGADAETDARLRDRNTSKWSTLSYAAVDGAYRNWTLEADDTITRVKVRSNNPFGAGTVDIVAATATSGITPTQETEILAYINGTVDNVGRRPLGDIPSVQSAVAIGATVSGTVTVDAAYTATTTQPVIEAAMESVFNASDIGGTIVPPAIAGVIVKSKLIKAVEALPGVISIVLSSPAADLPLTELQIVDPTLINFGGLAVFYG